MLREKIIKYSETIFLIIYILFSLAIFIVQFKYNNILKSIILYSSIILLIILLFSFKKSLKKFLNKKSFFILCIALGIIARISLFILI